MNSIKKTVRFLASMIKGGLLYIFCGKVLTQAISMISSIVVARFVDKNEYALLSYADNLYSYIGLASGVGLASALLILSQKDAYAKDKNRLLTFSVTAGCTVNLAMALLLCAGVAVIAIPFPGARIYCLLLLLSPVVNHVIQALLSWLRAAYQNKAYAAMGLVQAAGTCVLSIVLVWCIGAKGIVAARYAAALLTIICAVWVIRKRAPVTLEFSLEGEKKREMLRMGLSLMVANLCSGMMPINEAFLINNMIQDATVVANFKIAGLIPSQLYLVTNALVVYLFPIIARQEDKKKTLHTVYLAGMVTLAVVGLCVAVGALLTPWVLHLLYAGKYDDAVSMMYMLWAIRGINAALRVLPMNILAAMGETRFNAVLAFVTVIVHGILDAALIHFFGIGGIVLGAGSVYLVTGALYWARLVIVCRKGENEGVQN